MLKPSFANVLIYILFKYMLAYIVFMVTTGNYKMLQIGGIRNLTDLFYYLWMMLFFPVLEVMLFSAPIFMAFKIKNGTLFLAIIGLITVMQYLTYVYFTSQRYINNKGISIALIGLLVLGLFFFKTISLKFKRSK